jgi:hypothetical protein
VSSTPVTKLQYSFTILTGVSDTGKDYSPVSLILVNNSSPVLMIPAIT